MELGGEPLNSDIKNKKSVCHGLDCGKIDDSRRVVGREVFGRIWKVAASGSYRQLAALKKYFFDGLSLTGKWPLKAIGNYFCEWVFEEHRRAFRLGPAD